MDGIINVLKPPGMTYHDVVSFIRRNLGVKKAGHTGTLDPGASGVLVICLGRATRLARFITDSDKEYQTEVVFGVATDTGDSSGKVIEEINAGYLTEGMVREALPAFTGEIDQVPPMVSAIKLQGKKLYELARAGITVERGARKVNISELEYISGAGWGSEKPAATLRLTCSKGTYVRTLCEDLGKHLGCVAHMSLLTRHRVGAFSINNAFSLEDLQNSDPAGMIIPMTAALSDMPEVKVKSGAVNAVNSGAKLFLPGVVSLPEGLTEGGQVRLSGPDGLLAIAETTYDPADQSRVVFKPICVLKD